MEKETLEQEFNKIKEKHKYNIISATIILYGNEELSQAIPSLDKYDELDAKDNYEVATSIVDDIKNNCKDNSDKYEEIYEVCWRKIRNKISDKKSYYLS